MSTNGVLDGRWREYSGGSRSGSRLIRFLPDDRNHTTIEVFYVFDFNTGETELLSFDLSPECFQQLMGELSSRGYGCAKVKDAVQDFTFELRLVEGCLEFRVQGRPEHSVSGPLQLEMKDFHRISGVPFETI